MFREISGGVCNPAIALANIIWQEFTLSVDQDNENSQWTYEYAMSYFFGPVSGAFLAGVSYNMLQHTSEQMTLFAKQEGFDDKMMNVS